MSTLTQQKCEPCRGDVPPLTDEEISMLQMEIPQWRVEERAGVKRLERTFKLKDFRAALDLTSRVGEIAEEQGHHPAITTEWGKVTVAWWTHAIKGLHRNDFIMAARTDELIDESGR